MVPPRCLLAPFSQISAPYFGIARTSKNVVSGHFWAPTGRPWSGHALSSYRFLHPKIFVELFFANRDPSDTDLTTRMSKSCPKSTPLQPQHDFAVQKPRRPPHEVPFEAHFGASCRQLSPTLFEEKLHIFLMSSTLQSKCKTQNIHKKQCFFASWPFWCPVCLLPSIPKTAPVGICRARWTSQRRCWHIENVVSVHFWPPTGPPWGGHIFS